MDPFSSDTMTSRRLSMLSCGSTTVQQGGRLESACTREDEFEDTKCTWAFQFNRERTVVVEQGEEVHVLGEDDEAAGEEHNVKDARRFTVAFQAEFSQQLPVKPENHHCPIP